MTTRVDVTGWHEWWSTDPNRWKVLINKNKKRKKSLRVTNKIKAATTSTDSFLSETTDPFRQVNSITWLSFMSWNVVSMRINLHFFLKKLTTWSGCVMLVTNGTTRYRFVFFFFKKKKNPSRTWRDFYSLLPGLKEVDNNKWLRYSPLVFIGYEVV